MHKSLTTIFRAGRISFSTAGESVEVPRVERHPVIYALLEDGINRAARDQKIGEMIRSRFKLINGDSLELMRAVEGEETRPEVIYLDPMYPQKEKGAQVKKESQVLRLLAGKDRDSSKLIKQALKTAPQRVVVKRPAYAPPLADKEPDLVVKTKSNRFDIYHITT